MKQIAMLCAIAAAIAVAAAQAQADRIVTYAGKTLVGKIVQEDPDKVVINVGAENLTVPRVTIRTIEKGPAEKTPPEKGTETKPGEKAPSPAKPPQVVPAEIDPKDAAKAFGDAKSAVAAGDWIKAAGLLEGLLKLDPSAVPAENRLASLAVLATCYLQIKDAAGAARCFSRRALLVADENEKRRMLAAAEALKTTGSIAPQGKTLGRYDEAIEAGLAWKAEQLLDQAVQVARKATRLDDKDKLEKAALLCQDKLKEADLYAPGFADKHRQDVMAFLVQNVVDTAKQVIEFCTQERKELTRTRLASLAGRAYAQAWNERAKPYLAKRQAAEDAMKNLGPFTEKFELPSLYDAALCRGLLTDLEDLAYYPPETRNPTWYGTARTPERIKIELRRF